MYLYNKLVRKVHAICKQLVVYPLARTIHYMVTYVS
jgi:hypothetical protein